jgi:hypothetical protein
MQNVMFASLLHPLQEELRKINRMILTPSLQTVMYMDGMPSNVVRTNC